MSIRDWLRRLGLAARLTESCPESFTGMVLHLVL